MKCIKIVSVNYLNALLFNNSLKNWEQEGEIKLSLLPPSKCAEAIFSGQADIGLVPVGALLDNDKFNIISDYCIACDGEVRSVGIFYKNDLKKINTIYLDNESKTSSILTKIIFEKFLNIQPNYIEKKITERFEPKEYEGFLAIGDKALEILMKKNNFYNFYDLGLAWKKFTELPFVFALWITTKNIDNAIIQKLNYYLHNGIKKKDYILTNFNNIYCFDDLFIKKYLNYNVKFKLDDNYKKGLDLFKIFYKEQKEKNKI